MVGHLGIIFVRSALSFLCLLILARWMGRKQMAQLTYFDYITGITIGSIAAAMVVEPDVGLLAGLAGLIFWSVFTILLNIVILKSRKVRKLLDGEPCLLISNGQILEQNLQKMRYTLDDLMEELREKDVFNISDVQFAVVETDGMLSVQLKHEMKAVTKQDMQIAEKPQALPIELVMDGELIGQNLQQKNLTESWLINELKKRNIEDYSEITFACLGSNQQLYIDLRRDYNTESFHVPD